MTESALLITRVFNAPRSLVFKAWTEAEHLQHWWGPKGYTWVNSTLDLRPNGIFHYHLRSPQGEEQWGKFVYREITPPERLVFVNSFSDAQGNTVRAPFNADWPLEILNTLTFTEQDGKTTLFMQGIPINATVNEHQAFQAARKSVQGGFKGTLDQLDEYLARV